MLPIRPGRRQATHQHVIAYDGGIVRTEGNAQVPELPVMAFGSIDEDEVKAALACRGPCRMHPLQDFYGIAKNREHLIRAAKLFDVGTGGLIKIDLFLDRGDVSAAGFGKKAGRISDRGPYFKDPLRLLKGQYDSKQFFGIFKDDRDIAVFGENTQFAEILVRFLIKRIYIRGDELADDIVIHDVTVPDPPHSKDVR